MRIPILAVIAMCTGQGGLSQTDPGTIRILTELPPSEAHDVYAQVLADGLRDAGFELPDDAGAVPMGRGSVRGALEPGSIGFVRLEDQVGEGDAAAALIVSPAIFSSFEEGRQVSQSPLGDAARSEVRDESTVSLRLWSYALDALVSKAALDDASDVEGLRVAVSDSLSEVFLAELGASSLRIASAQVLYSAIERGIGDATIWPHEELNGDFLSLTAGGTIIPDHGTRIASTIVDADWWRELGAGEQGEIFEILERAESAASEVLAAGRDELAGLSDGYSISTASWADFSSESVDAALAETIGEAASVDPQPALGLLADMRAFWEDSSLAPEAPLPSEREAVDAPTRVFFATDRRYDPRFGQLTRRLANSGSPTGTITCGELRPAGPFRIGETSGAIRLTRGTKVLDQTECVPQIGQAVGSAGGRVLVFIHGYRTTFEGAVRTGLAFARDIAAAGVVVIWSWPSEGDLGDYAVDEGWVGWSELQFGNFFGALAATDPVEGIDIMAHSMGTRLAANFMRDHWPDAEAAVVLAAADLARPNFVQALPQAPTAAPSVLVARSDWALWASGKLRSGHQRVGRAKPLFLHRDVDTIDLSAFDRTISLNHGHAFTVPEVVSDLSRLFGGQWRAVERGLESRRGTGANQDHYVIR